MTMFSADQLKDRSFWCALDNAVHAERCAHGANGFPPCQCPLSRKTLGTATVMRVDGECSDKDKAK